MKILNCCALFFFFLFIFVQPISADSDQTIEIIVEKYDNISSISKQYLEDFRQWREVAEYNGLDNPHLIHPGQKILIPMHLLKGIPIRGEVTFIKGAVSIQAEGTEESRPLHHGDTVWHRNRITTGDDGSVEVSYDDGTSFLLRSNTDVILRKAVLKEEKHILRRLIQKTGRSISRLKKITGKENRYEIQTPSAIAAARGTEFRISVDEHEATRSEVLKNVVALEAMRQQVKVKEGEGTLVRKNEPPLKPRKLLIPPVLTDPQTLYRSLPLKFSFTAPEGASSIRVMLSRDREVKEILKQAVIKSGDTLDMIGIADGIYYLQVLSIDDEGIEGLPSEPEKIQVRVNPLPPIIQYPQDALEFRETSVEIQWLKVTDAARYHLQIAEDRAFLRMVIDKDDLKKNEFAESFEFSTYYFRVSSIADDGYQGVWSDTQMFTIIPPPPAPSLEKPALDEEEILLRWRELGDGISYRFQMSRDDRFQDIIFEERLDKPTINIHKPDVVGTYFVRTSSIDREGYEGDFSSPQSFEIEQRTPLKVMGAIGAIFLMLVFL